MAVVPYQPVQSAGSARVQSLADVLNRQLPDPWANRQLPEPKKPGGWKGLVAGALNFAPIKYGVLKPLELLAVPKNAIVSGLAEFRDAVDGNPNTQASFADFKRQALDPTYGFGTAFKPFGDSKWGNRFTGLIGDLVLDPLMYVNTGGRLLGRGTLEVADYAGRELLARKAFGVFVAAEDSVADAGAKAARILQEGVPAARKLLSKAEQETIGLAESGLYMFRGKYIRSMRIPGSGLVGDALVASGSRARRALTSRKFGQMLQAATMAGEKDIAAARLALLRGEIPSQEVGHVLYTIASMDSKRAAQSAAQLYASDTVRGILGRHKLTSDPALARQIVDVLEDPALYQSASPSVRAAADDVRTFFNDSHKQLADVLFSVDRAAGPKYLDNYVQHQLTPEAWEHLMQNKGALASTLESLDIKEMNPSAMLFSRRLQEGSLFFGRELRADELTIAKLNEIARKEGGFVGDFFAHDINKVIDRYGSRWIDEMGRAAAIKYMSDNGVLEALMFSEEISKEQLQNLTEKLLKTNAKFEQSLSAFGESGANLEKSLISFRDALKAEAGKADANLAAEVAARGQTVDKALEEMEKFAAAHAKLVEQLDASRGEVFAANFNSAIQADIMAATIKGDVERLEAALAQLREFNGTVALRERNWKMRADDFIAQAERNLEEVSAAWKAVQDSSAKARELANWVNKNWDEISSGKVIQKSTTENLKKVFNLLNSSGLVEKTGRGRGLPGGVYSPVEFRTEVLRGWWEEAHGLRPPQPLSEIAAPAAVEGPAFMSPEARVIGRMFGPNFKLSTLEKMNFVQAQEIFDGALASGSVAGAHDASAVLASNLLMVYGDLASMPSEIREVFDEWVTHVETLKKLRDWERSVATAWRSKRSTKLEASLVKLRNQNEQLGLLVENAMQKQTDFALLEADVYAFREALAEAEQEASLLGKRVKKTQQVEFVSPSRREAAERGLLDENGRAIKLRDSWTKDDLVRAEARLAKMRDELDMAWAMAVTDSYGNISVIEAAEDLVYGGRTFTDKTLGSGSAFGASMVTIPEGEAIDAGLSIFGSKAPRRSGTVLGAGNPNDAAGLSELLQMGERRSAATEEQLSKVTAREAAQQAQGARVRDIYVQQFVGGSTRWVKGSAPILGDSAATMRRLAANRLEVLGNEARVARAYQALMDAARQDGVVLDSEIVSNFLWDTHMRGRYEMHRANALAARQRQNILDDARLRVERVLGDNPSPTAADYSAAAQSLAEAAGLNGGGKEVALSRALFDAESEFKEATRLRAAIGRSGDKKMVSAAQQRVDAAGAAYRAAVDDAKKWLKTTNRGLRSFNEQTLKQILAPYYSHVTDKKSWEAFSKTVDSFVAERSRSASALVSLTGQQFVTRRNQAKLGMLLNDLEALKKEIAIHDELKSVLTDAARKDLRKRAVQDAELQGLLHRLNVIEYTEVTAEARKQAEVAAATLEAFRASPVHAQAEQDQMMRNLLDRLSVVDGETLTVEDWRQMGFLTPDVWDAEAARQRVELFNTFGEAGRELYRFDPQTGSYTQVTSAEGFGFGERVFVKVDETRWIPAADSVEASTLRRVLQANQDALQAMAAAREAVQQEGGAQFIQDTAVKLLRLRDDAVSRMQDFEFLQRGGVRREVPESVVGERRQITQWLADFDFRSQNAPGAGMYPASGSQPPRNVVAGEAEQAKRFRQRLSEIDNEWFRSDSVFVPSRHEQLAYDNDRILVERIDAQLSDIEGKRGSGGTLRRQTTTARQRQLWEASQARETEIRSRISLIERQLESIGSPYRQPGNTELVYSPAWTDASTKLRELNTAVDVATERVRTTAEAAGLRGRGITRAKLAVARVNRRIESLQAQAEAALLASEEAGSRAAALRSALEEATAAGDRKAATTLNRQLLVAEEDIARQAGIADAVRRELRSVEREGAAAVQELRDVLEESLVDPDSAQGALTLIERYLGADLEQDAVDRAILELESAVQQRDAMRPQLHAVMEQNPPRQMLTEKARGEWRLAADGSSWERFEAHTWYDPVGAMPNADPSKVPNITFTRDEWDSLFSYGFETPIPGDAKVAGSITAAWNEAQQRVAAAKSNFSRARRELQAKADFAREMAQGARSAETRVVWEERLASIEAQIESARSELVAAMDASAAVDPKVLLRAQTKMRRLLSRIDPSVFRSEAFDSAISAKLAEKGSVDSVAVAARRAALKEAWESSASRTVLEQSEKMYRDARLAERASLVSAVGNRWRNSEQQAAERAAELVGRIRKSTIHESMFGSASDLVAGSAISESAKDFFVADPSVALQRMGLSKPSGGVVTAKAESLSRSKELDELEKQLGLVSRRRQQVASTVYDSEYNLLGSITEAAKVELSKAQGAAKVDPGVEKVIASRRKELQAQVDALKKTVDDKSRVARPAVERAEKQVAQKLEAFGKLTAEEAEVQAKYVAAKQAYEAARAISPSEMAALERSAVAEANVLLVEDLLDAHRFALGVRDQSYKGKRILVDWGGTTKARSIEDVRGVVDKATRAERALADGFEEIAKGGKLTRKPLTAERRAALEATVEKGRAYRDALEKALLSDVEAGRLSQLAKELQSWLDSGTTVLNVGSKDSLVVPALAGSVKKEEDALRAVLAQYLNAEAKMLSTKADLVSLETKFADPNWWKMDVTPLLKEGFEQLESWGLPNMQASKWVKEFFDNFSRTEDPAVAQALGKFLGWYTKRFKAYAVASPGFHIRNAIDNTFRVFSAGAETRNMFEAETLFGKWVSARRAGELDKFLNGLGEQRAVFEKALQIYHGSGSGQGGAALSELLNTVKLKKIDENFWLRANRNLTERVEGSARFMLAYDSAVRGMDVEAATLRVRRYMFDYSAEGRSNLDRSMRHIVPFWTYMSKNLPFQIVNRWKNPKAYIAVNAIFKNLQGGDGMSIPSYLMQAGAVDLGGGNALTVDLGQNRVEEQLTMLGDPTRLLKDVNPGLRLPMELAGNRKYYNNQPFSAQPSEIPGGPLSPVLAAALGMLGLTDTAGARTTPMSPEPGSDVVSSKTAYALMNALPPLAMLERLVPATQQYADRQENSWLGWLGIPYRSFTPEQQAQNREQAMRELRDALAAGAAK